MNAAPIIAIFCLLGFSLPAQDAPAVDPKVALARELIKIMDVEKTFEGMTAQVKEMAMSGFPKGKLTPEEEAKSKELQSKVVELAMQSAKGMIDKMDVIYADVYTMEEMEAMKRFFTSPEGKSMLAKQPLVMEKSMPLIQAMQQELIPKIEELIEEATNK